MSLTGHNPDTQPDPISKKINQSARSDCLRRPTLIWGYYWARSSENDDSLLNAATVLLPDKTRYYKNYVTEAEAEYF